MLCLLSFLVSHIEKSGRHLKKSLRCYTKCFAEFLSTLSSENCALYQHRKWSFSSSNKKPIIAGLSFMFVLDNLPGLAATADTVGSTTLRALSVDKLK